MMQDDLTSPDPLNSDERAYLVQARLGRLATANVSGQPSVVPVCFALLPAHAVSVIDEKPKRLPTHALRRVRDLRANPTAALVVDHWSEDWTALGWVQLRGPVAFWTPEMPAWQLAIEALRVKYPQYNAMNLDGRPVIALRIETVRQWGSLTLQNQ